MKHFYKILLLIMLFSWPSAGFSQQGDKDKVEALRVSFITKKLELTTNESEKFWPVYNEYNDKIKALRKNLRQSIKKSPDNLNDKEAEELYLLDMKSKQAEADVHKQYGEKIKGIIGVRKYVTLRKAEEEFKEELLKSARNN